MQFKIVQAGDGSGKGAALIAAIAARLEQDAIREKLGGKKESRHNGVA